ncbi:hypothetical protein DL95DRAFT_467218 [Leptodontidium sp. 2 PMI_412]|nr:hypothetical protein DL95DRAFT_467218 [Leptodontidium sp. 2 PMI_412]
MSYFSAPTGFPFVAVYGEPDEILFDGNIYTKVGMRVEDLEEFSFALVVTLTEYNDEYDMEDGPLDVACAGPQLVVFNRAVYSKSFIDTAYVSDEVIRTVLQPHNPPIYHPPAASLARLTQEHDFFQPPGSVLNSSFAPVPPVAPTLIPVTAPVLASSNHQPIRATTTSMNTGYLAGWLAARSTRSYGGAIVQAQATSPPIPTRFMPARATVTTNQTLPYGFDLTPAVRAVTRFQPPLSHNYFMNAAGQQQLHTRYTRPSRMPWEDNHKVYVWELVLLATLQLNRPVERRDFVAITEALHRQFDGTTNAAGVQYPLRGFNTVHSMVTKHPGWADFVKYVLP